MTKKKNFLIIIYTLGVTDVFALYKVKRVRTLRHINNDVAKCALSAKTETIGAGV